MVAITQTASTKAFIRLLKKLKASSRIANDAQLCADIGWDKSSLSQVVNGKRNVPQWVLEKASEVYGLRWTDHMEKPSADISLVPLSFHKDYALGCHDPAVAASLPSFGMFYATGADGELIRAFEMDGSGMQPTVQDGDLLMGSYRSRSEWTIIPPGQMVIVVHDGAVVAARLMDAGKANTVLKFDAHSDLLKKITTSDIKELWVVRSKVTTYLDPPDTKIDQLQARVDQLAALITKKTKQ